MKPLYCAGPDGRSPGRRRWLLNELLCGIAAGQCFAVRNAELTESDTAQVLTVGLVGACGGAAAKLSSTELRAEEAAAKMSDPDSNAGSGVDW